MTTPTDIEKRLEELAEGVLDRLHLEPLLEDELTIVRCALATIGAEVGDRIHYLMHDGHYKAVAAYLAALERLAGE